MPRALAFIPEGVPITDRLGAITEFFRLRWQDLINGYTSSALAAAVRATGLTAALATTALYVVPPTAGGWYTVFTAIQKTVADGVSSSLTVTISWVSGGQTLTHTFSALTTDTIGSEQSNAYPIYVDASSTITIAIAYASNTPAKMTYTYQAAAGYFV